MFCSMPILMTIPSDGQYDPAGFAVMCAIFIGLATLFLAPHYIINALGLYSIASRRGISKPWLAWIPLGDAWILGRISDQYQALVLHKQKKRGATLLTLQAIGCVAYILIMALFVVAMMSLDADATQYQCFIAMIPAILAMLVSIGVGIAAKVFTYLAKYDLFRSCDPKNAALCLACSLIVQFVMPTFEILQPIFVLLCRNKDEGMPRPIEIPENQE